jgi:hypothetical protein
MGPPGRVAATPYSLPTALAFLKVPTGALTAVLGIVLLRGQFIPGLSALDTSGQILAWAARRSARRGPRRPPTARPRPTRRPSGA